jgi:PAS domain S-box-containing protein
MNLLSNFDPLLLKVIESSSDFFGIADDTGAGILVNNSGRKIFGLKPDDDISKLNMLDFISAESRKEFQEELVSKSLICEKVKRIISVKCFSTGEVFNMDFDFFYIPESQGNKPMYMAFGKDLRTSDANLKRLKLFEAVIENSHDFVGIADNNLQPIYLNPAGRKMLGIPLNQNLNEVQIEDCYPEELRDFARNEILHEMTEKGLWSGETYFQHFVTKEKIPVHDTHFAIQDAKTDKPLGHATITRDMTKEKKLQKIIESEKAKMLQASKLSTLGEMAAGVAHEINNPLSVIGGSISILKRGIQDQSQIRKLDMISKSVDRIARIVKGLRKFSHSSNGINKLIFSSKSLFEDCIELLAGKALSHQVKLINECAQEFEVYADEVQIEQIIINLMNNAIDANSRVEGAWVKLHAELAQNCIKLIVQDNGHGIEKSIEEKLFDPFFTTKPPGKGTGLGLSIAKGIANDHGGDLYYEKLDGHTAFILSIPARSL